MNKSQIRYLKYKNLLIASWNNLVRPDIEKDNYTSYHLSSLRPVFSLKNYFTNSLNPNNKLNSFFYKKYFDNLKLGDSDFDNRIQELFEYKDKTIYFTAALVSRDITELNSVDNFKENFPYTVSFDSYINSHNT
jgi:hypothetical protein